jgi:hypothetical protein
MSVTIAGIEFDNHSYDERGDVLYVDTPTTTRAIRRMPMPLRKVMASSGTRTGRWPR